MLRNLLLGLALLTTMPLCAQTDCLWMSFGLGGVQARKGLFRADVSATYLRYNRWGCYLDLQANGRTYDGIESRALVSYSGYGGGVAYNFNPYGNQGQKIIGRLGITYGSGDFIDSVKQTPSSLPGDNTMVSEWFNTTYKSIGVEISIEGMIVLNRPNQAWGMRLVTVLNRHPFIGGCIRYNIGAF